MYGTRYQLFNKDGKTLLDFSDKVNRIAACFADYNRDIASGGKGVIKLLIDKVYPHSCTAKMLLTKEQVLVFLEEIQSIFPTSFEERDDEYVVILKEEEYKNKTHVRAALDFIRMLWENDINTVLVKYFELKDLFKGLDILVTLQAIYMRLSAECDYGSLDGHALPCGYSGYILTSKQFLEELEKPKNQKDGSAILWRYATGNKYESSGYGSPNHIYTKKANIATIDLEKEGAIQEIVDLVNQ